MPISGLLITLAADPARRSSALAALMDHPSIEVGDSSGARRAVVVETPNSEADQVVWQWLNDLPGIASVDVVYVHFDEENPGETNSLNPQNARTHDQVSATGLARGAS